jgi:hypothetical protein
MITLYKEYVIDTEEDVIMSELFTNSNTLNQRLIYKNFRLGSFLYDRLNFNTASASSYEEKLAVLANLPIIRGT